jgi:acyl-coenzyme A thioesterase PaaI-like protein
MALSDVLDSARVSSGTAELTIGEDWLQGRSLFGGVQAIAGLAAMRDLVPHAIPLRTLQVTFVAPVAAGKVRAQARVLRTGRSATQVEARIVDAESTQALMIGVFGAARASQVRHLPRAAELEAGSRTRMPYVEGVVPAFTQHFVAHWLRGGMPYSGSESRASSVALDLLDPGPCSEAHLLALADFIPPVALSLLSTPAPGSSLTWMLECFGADPSRHPLEGWRVDSEMVAAQDGYTSQSNRLWAPDGSLAALSRQSMVVFA